MIRITCGYTGCKHNATHVDATCDHIMPLCDVHAELHTLDARLIKEVVAGECTIVITLEKRK